MIILQEHNLAIDAQFAKAHTDSDIIALQLARFMGKGMRVKVYARKPTRCPVCQSRFNLQKFICPNHKDIRPSYLRVQISGIDDKEYAPKGYRDIYSDQDGNPLSFVNTGAFMAEIQKRIVLDTFDIREFLPDEKNVFLVKNYSVKYLSAQENRAGLPQGSDKWLSRAGYREIEQYVRLYIVPWFANQSIKEIRSERQVENWLDNLVSVKDGLPVSRTVKQKARNALRHMMNWAAKQGDILPVRFKFPDVKKAKRKLVTLDANQQTEIISVITKTNSSDSPIFRWTAKKPHRTNENRALRLRDFDFSQRVKGGVKMYQCGGVKVYHLA